MKRQEIKMKLLVSIERTKSKYEILSSKLNELLVDLDASHRTFLTSLYDPFAATKQTFLKIGPTLTEDYKFQEGILEPQIPAESPLKEKQAIIVNALKQLRTNYETLKKNNELMDTFAGDLGKDFDFTKGNIEKLEEDLKKLQERNNKLSKKAADLRDEVTSALVDSDYTQQKIIKLNTEIKNVEDQRGEVEKILGYIKERLTAWKKHNSLLPHKHEKVASHVQNTMKAMDILRKEAVKIAKLIEILSRPAQSPTATESKIETSPLKTLENIEPEDPALKDGVVKSSEKVEEPAKQALQSELPEAKEETHHVCEHIHKEEDKKVEETVTVEENDVTEIKNKEEKVVNDNVEEGKAEKTVPEQVKNVEEPKTEKADLGEVNYVEETKTEKIIPEEPNKAPTPEEQPKLVEEDKDKDVSNLKEVKEPIIEQLKSEPVEAKKEQAKSQEEEYLNDLEDALEENIEID